MTKLQVLHLIDRARHVVSGVDEDDFKSLSIATETLATDGHVPAGFKGIVLDVTTTSGGNVLARFPLASADKPATRPMMRQPNK